MCRPICFRLAGTTGPLARHHLHTSETQNQKGHRLVAMPRFVDSHGDEISGRPCFLRSPGRSGVGFHGSRNLSHHRSRSLSARIAAGVGAWGAQSPMPTNTSSLPGSAFPQQGPCNVAIPIDCSSANNEPRSTARRRARGDPENPREIGSRPWIISRVCSVHALFATGTGTPAILTLNAPRLVRVQK
jgi:hypothetical protein